MERQKQDADVPGFAVCAYVYSGERDRACRSAFDVIESKVRSAARSPHHFRFRYRSGPNVCSKRPCRADL